jgi:hypothetical protein
MHTKHVLKDQYRIEGRASAEIVRNDPHLHFTWMVWIDPQSSDQRIILTGSVVSCGWPGGSFSGIDESHPG